MLTVLTCIFVFHDLWFVGLAALLCVATSSATMFVLDWSFKAPPKTRWIWTIVPGLCGGFGIWSTHFIAMLGYAGTEVVGYKSLETIVSLALALVLTSMAAIIAGSFESRLVRSFAGLALGSGITGMHFLGMAGAVIPGDLTWNGAYTITSLILCGALSFAAFWWLAGTGQRKRRIGVSTVFLTLAIVLMHFTAMAAFAVLPGPAPADTGTQISPSSMTVVVATVCFSLLTACVTAAYFAMNAENAAKMGSENFRLLVQGIQDYAIYMLDKDGNVSNWNIGAERAKGYKSEEIIGKHFSIFFSEEDRRAGLPEKTLATARTNGKSEIRGLRYRKDGSSFWAHVHLVPILNDSGKLAGYAKITKDITREKTAADQLQTLSNNLDAAMENMAHAVCLFDADERLVLCNSRYSAIMNLPAAELKPGMSYDEVLAAWYGRHYPSGDWKARASEYHERVRRLLKKGGGSVSEHFSYGISVQMNYNPMPDGGWVTTFEDITERLRSEEKIAHMARHDSLTGLPNRTFFQEHLDHELAHVAKAGLKLAILAMDLNKFKEINDQHGHEAGDAVLMKLANALANCLKAGEFASRLGGDEFAATKRFNDISEINEFIKRIEHALSVSVDFGGYELKAGGSIGITIFPQDATSASQLLSNADMAMYRAKHSLLHQVCYYEAGMDEVARERRQLANELWLAVDRNWLAVDRNEFLLHYQIQRSISSGEVTGHEVLLRWNHSVHGSISPMDFIPLAEECGAILPIGEWVLRTACREAASWPEGGKIAVNLSPVQIAHSDMPAVVKDVLAETGLPPERLELEITESAIIVDKARALEALTQIKALGVSIAIDDFGTGYSSLETLRAFPFDKIKLDRSFMAELEQDVQAKAIVRAILALGKSLDVTVLAEGVETRSQLDVLEAEGCHEAQGYFLGRPEKLETILEKSRRIPFGTEAA